MSSSNGNGSSNGHGNADPLHLVDDDFERYVIPANTELHDSIDPLTEVTRPIAIDPDLLEAGYDVHAGDDLSDPPDEIDLSAGLVPDEYDRLLDEIIASCPDAVPSEAEESQKATQVFCVRHTDPSFNEKTWCGKSVTEASGLFNSTDDALYIMSENASFANEADDICLECVSQLRDVLTPGPKFHEGAEPPVRPDLPAWVNREALKTLPPEVQEAVRELDRLLYPEVTDLLTLCVGVPSEAEFLPALSKRMRRLQSHFLLYVEADEDIKTANGEGSGILSDVDNPRWRTAGSTNLDWNQLEALFLRTATQVYREALEDESVDPDLAARNSWIFAAVYVNEIIRGTRWMMTAFFNLWLEEAFMHSIATCCRLSGVAAPPVNSQIDDMVASYARRLRARFGQENGDTQHGKSKARPGRKPTDPELIERFAKELMEVIRSPVNIPSVVDLVKRIPCMREAAKVDDAAESAITKRRQKADERLRVGGYDLYTKAQTAEFVPEEIRSHIKGKTLAQLLKKRDIKEMP
jgi:hypothetical protein